MAKEVPPTTKEGALVRRARKATRERLTIPQAAERAGISAETWGHMERGYKPVGKGSPPMPYSPAADVLARAARVVGLGLEELEEADRADAAAVLARMTRTDVASDDLVGVSFEVEGRGRMFFAVHPDLSDEKRALLKKWAEEMADVLYREELTAGRVATDERPENDT